uniref:Ankyrin repeat domain-containing protein 13C-like n=1 Tax=Phallusia mammillata TaxID=59560 RepID=A0A6F9D793_9ASCI|nr:ankyrin repeat domain-containing protein 13C-like [Phallusia mammillata]
MAGESDLSECYPLHWMVWHNQYEKLRELLSNPEKDTEKNDSRGRTVLHLAVSLGHIECARLLLHNGANVLAENKDGWSVLHEAISTGDPEMVALILQFRDYRQACIRLEAVPKLLSELRNSPDFYVEMKWEFNSWIPLLSKVCPSDVCKIWKKGSCIRVDTTLLGFENMTWKRGDRSFVFKGCDQGATLLDINHDSKEVIEEVLFDDNVLSFDMFTPSQDVILHRLTHPVVCTHLNVDTIQLEVSTYGFLGWRSDRHETVNGYKAAVHSASNVEIVTKTRAEHVDDKNSKKSENNSIASRFLKSFSGFSLDHNATSSQTSEPNEHATAGNPEGLSPEQYFSDNQDKTVDIGRPKETTVKIQKFKGCLWMCKEFPLSLTQQVLPIIDLMSTTSPHFRKLGDFIKMKLPAGFPVKIEIPVFHVLNACVTFDNINGKKSSEVKAVPFVSEMQPEGPEGAPLEVIVEEECFEAPVGYQVMSISSNKTPGPRVDEDERLLQLAIQQSLMMQEGTEEEQVTLMEALSNSSPGSNRNRNHSPLPPLPHEDEFQKALRLSALEADKYKALEEQENEELRKALELSMLDK